MSKKLVSAICACIFVAAGGFCAIAYATINSKTPWWLVVFAAGIICAILSQIGVITREKKKAIKHKKIIGCICSSISMISVFIFLVFVMLNIMKNSWIIVVIGGILSFIIYTIDKGIQSDKESKK